MWHVNIEGHPREIGKAYACLFKDKLLYYLEETKNTLKYDQNKNRIISITEKVSDNISKIFPYLAQEIEGCAIELGVSISDIVVLIAFNDLWWGMDYSVKDTLDDIKVSTPGDCTNLGFCSNCAEPMLGQTYDLPDSGKYFIQSLSPAEGASMLIVHRIAPAQASCGINKFGLCIGAVSSFCNTHNLDGVPVNILMRAVLQTCVSTDEAIQLFKKHLILSGSYTVQVMQKDGKSIVLELSPAAIEIIDTKESYLYNTSFISTKMQKFYKGVPVGRTTTRAKDRLNTFKNLLQQETQLCTLETMERILSDHSPIGPIWDWTTAIAVVMFPQRTSICVYEGAPNVMNAESYSIIPKLIPHKS